MIVRKFAPIFRMIMSITFKQLSFDLSPIMMGRKCAVNGKLMGWFSATKMHSEFAFLDIETVQSQEKNHLQPQDSQQIDLIALSQSIIHYPYIDFPSNLIQNYHQNPPYEQAIKDIIAFRCLKNISQAQLSLAIQILDPFMTNFKKVNLNQYDTGRQIFTAYFEKHRQRLEKGYREGTTEDKIKYLIVLNNYKLNNSTAERVKQISEEQLLAWDQSGLAVVYYSQLLIKSKLPYQHLFKVIQQKLKNESQQTVRDRITIVEAMLSIPDFQLCYPKQIVETGLAIISKNIELVSNLQMLQILRFIYEQNSKQSMKLTCKMIKYLSELDLWAEPSRVKMLFPLVLKTLKYAQVIEIQTDTIFLEFLAKQQTFTPLFKQFSKLYFHTLLFLWSKAGQNENIKQKTKDHFIKCLKAYTTSPVNCKDQLIKFLTLLSNHQDLLNNEEKSQAKRGLLTIMSQSQDRDVHYKCLHFIIKDNDSFFKSKENQQQVSKYLQLYFQSSCVKNNLDQLQIKSHLDENIHLAYLLTINKSNIIKSYPHIEAYDFSKQEMIGHSTFQRLIAYLNIAPKAADLHGIFSNLQPFAIYHLSKKRLSYRTIITLLQLGAKINYDKKHLYQRIQKSIFQILVKYNNFTIKMQDLHLIKNTMLKHNLGSPYFREMILRSIQRHGEWKTHKKRYIESQKKYWDVPVSQQDEHDLQQFK